MKRDALTASKNDDNNNKRKRYCGQEHLTSQKKIPSRFGGLCSLLKRKLISMVWFICTAEKTEKKDRELSLGEHKPWWYWRNGGKNKPAIGYDINRCRWKWQLQKLFIFRLRYNLHTLVRSGKDYLILFITSDRFGLGDIPQLTVLLNDWVLEV